MRYLIQFRHAGHVKLFDLRFPGVIEPQIGVLDYVVDSEPPRFGAAVVSEYVEPADEQNE